MSTSLPDRVARHAALGDPTRLAIVDELARSDRTPGELLAVADVSSNLLAHHLETLERVGLISRHRSSGDGRRRYVRLEPAALDELIVATRPPPRRALFVCTHNSARSQLAAALWHRATGHEAASVGTHPADAVHPEAIAAGRRAGLDLSDARPTALTSQAAGEEVDLVVTVCDLAHEELAERVAHCHWSIADPVAVGTPVAFDAALAELTDRIASIAR